MGFKRFSLMIAARTILIMLTLVLLAYLLNLKGYLISTFVVAILLVVQSFLLHRFVNKTNNELTRFFEAARYADYSQRFEFNEIGAGFGELGKTFTDILKGFQQNRTVQEEEYRHLKALIEHVPVPLISLHADGKVSLWNNSARRLIGANAVTRFEDFKQFGEDFFEQLQTLVSGQRRLLKFEVDGMEQQLVVQATEIIVSGRQEKLLSLQDIQSELDGVQLQSWQDLVRVLTHEIMNSITPVASLAKTAADLIDDAKSKLEPSSENIEDLVDASDAIHTVARRSDGLMKFVGSYRRLTRLPEPNKRSIKVEALVADVSAIVTQDWKQKGIALNVKITPPSLDVLVDKDMVEQLLINLLKNAEQALEAADNANVNIEAYLNKRGHVVIDISDSGAGIPEDIAKKIFVPFFTTKREGSGVGLALTRQVMIAHGGSVKLKESKLGGACFRLTF
jgi:nitrogen fixation/metabolism regulation signal transduction histidine kinase